MTSPRIRRPALIMLGVMATSLIACAAFYLWLVSQLNSSLVGAVTPMSTTARFETAIVTALGPDFDGLDMSGAVQYRAPMQPDGLYLVPLRRLPVRPDLPAADAPLSPAGFFAGDMTLDPQVEVLQTFAPGMTLLPFINPDKSGYILGWDT